MNALDIHQLITISRTIEPIFDNNRWMWHRDGSSYEPSLADIAAHIDRIATDVINLVDASRIQSGRILVASGETTDDDLDVYVHVGTLTRPLRAAR